MSYQDHVEQAAAVARDHWVAEELTQLIEDLASDGGITQKDVEYLVSDVTRRVVNLRQATVDATRVGWGSHPLDVVNDYLPANYTATLDGDTITITGSDKAGWTLEDYVIPRLASGMIYATEVTS